MREDDFPSRSHEDCMSIYHDADLFVRKNHPSVLFPPQVILMGYLPEHTLEPVYSGHLRFLEDLSVIARCPLHRGSGFFFREETLINKSDYR